MQLLVVRHSPCLCLRALCCHWQLSAVCNLSKNIVGEWWVDCKRWSSILVKDMHVLAGLWPCHAGHLTLTPTFDTP